MMRGVFLILGLAIAILVSGCAQNEFAEAPKESSIPWNRPASWEGAGALGGLNMGSR